MHSLKDSSWDQLIALYYLLITAPLLHVSTTPDRAGLRGFYCRRQTGKCVPLLDAFTSRVNSQNSQLYPGLNFKLYTGDLFK